MRRILCVIAIVCLLGGCASQQDTVFTCKDLTLTLPGLFEDLSSEPYGQDADFLLGQDKLIVMGLSEPKNTLENLDLQTYTALVIRGNGLDCPAETLDDRYRFAYEAPVDGTLYTYTAVTLETEANFWIVQCYCPSEDFPVLEKKAEKILAGIAADSPDSN